MDDGTRSAPNTAPGPLIFLLDERQEATPLWLSTVETQGRLVRAVSLIGARELLARHAITLGVLRLVNPVAHLQRVVHALRLHKGCERLPFVAVTRQAWEGSWSDPDVHVVLERLADLKAPGLMAAIVGRSESATKKAASPASTVRRVDQTDDSTMWTQSRLLTMFLQGSLERAQRCAELCGAVRAGDQAPPPDVVSALRDLLKLMRGEASVLRLRPLIELLLLADRQLEQASSPKTVPAGVAVLCIAIHNVAAGIEEGFDAEAIRARMEAR